MSVQAGIWNFDGQPVDRTLVENYSQRLANHGPDGESRFFDGAIAMLYRPFHTTSESRLERQPHTSAAGNIITWDGRLDNREELAAQLTDRPSIMMNDVDVVAAAFDRWGSECFSKFIGDWAFAGWNPKERTLTLAIDYMAIKHLYYYLQPHRAVWCTDLEAVVLQSGDQFDLDDEYVAGYLTHSPVPGRTPYFQIRSVEPGSFVQIHNGQARPCSYWKSPHSRIRYQTDAEYEEHFRYVFRQAVRRRLRSDAPILADLSGGLDSSSIVCMTDDIMTKEGAHAPRVDTFSHYDLGEPDGDDFHYATIVEKKRGRVGHCLNITKFPASLLPDHSSFIVAPGRESNALLRDEQLRILKDGGYKIGLSGVGGDEMLGGVPDPRPELADLLVKLQFTRFVRQTISWSLIKKTPWIHLALRAAVLLAPAAVRARLTREASPSPWINKQFATRWRLSGRQLGPTERYGSRLPSKQECIRTIVALSLTQASDPTCPSGTLEKRFPYLDQHLVEFISSIPRNQVIRPGQRRSLMRRSLAGLVPDEILSRRTKGTVSRRPLVAMANEWQELDRILETCLTSRFGYVDHDKFSAALLSAKTGNAPQLLSLLYTLSLELWLHHAVMRRVIRMPSVFRLTSSAIPRSAYAK